MNTALTLIVAAAARIGAPVIKSLLRDKVGGAAGELGGTIIDAVAKKAGVSATEIDKLPDAELESAVRAVEADAPTLLNSYLASQQEANRLMLAEMKTGSGFGWLWRPAAMWLMLVCVAWYVFVMPLLAAALTAWAGTPIAITPGIDFGSFTTIFVTFTGLYMGGHTAKAVFKK